MTPGQLSRYPITPDGRYVLLTTAVGIDRKLPNSGPGQGGGNQIELYDRQTGKLSVLLSAAACAKAAIWPKFSPDGTKLVWSQMLEGAGKSDPNGRWAIMLADIDLEAGTLSNVRSWQDPNGLPAFYECYGWVPTPSELQATPNLGVAPPENTALVLIDAPEDGCVEEQGWVEATVSAERACQLLAPLCYDLCPDLAHVTRVTLAPIKDPGAGDHEAQRWLPPDQVRKTSPMMLPSWVEVESLDDRLAEAKEFWQIPVVKQGEISGTLIFASTTRATSTGFRGQQLFTLPDSLPLVAPTRISPAIEQTVSGDEVEAGVKALVEVYGSGRSELDDPAVRAALLAVRPPLDCFHEFAHFNPANPDLFLTSIGIGADGGDELCQYDLSTQGADGLLGQPTQVSWFNGRREGFKVVQVAGWPKPAYTVESSGAFVDGAFQATVSPDLLSQTVSAWRIEP